MDEKMRNDYIMDLIDTCCDDSHKITAKEAKELDDYFQLVSEHIDDLPAEDARNVIAFETICIIDDILQRYSRSSL